MAAVQPALPLPAPQSLETPWLPELEVEPSPRPTAEAGAAQRRDPRLSARLPGVSKGPLPECGPGVAGWCGCVAAPCLPAQISDTARSGGQPHGWSPRVEDSAITAAVDGARCLYMDRECGSVRARVSSAAPRCQRGFPSAF